MIEALKGRPRVRSLWLPTYAPRLSPIEKVWHRLRQDVLKMHRLADDWEAMPARLHRFLDWFATGWPRLLEYIGIRGQGRLARMILGT